MKNTARNSQEEDEQAAASVRVQLISHPELKQLDRRSVEELKILHREYVIQIKAQGSKSMKPVPIAYCVPRLLREVMAMEKGIEFDMLNEGMIIDFLNGQRFIAYDEHK